MGDEEACLRLVTLTTITTLKVLVLLHILKPNLDLSNNE